MASLFSPGFCSNFILSLKPSLSIIRMPASISSLAFPISLLFHFSPRKQTNKQTKKKTVTYVLVFLCLPLIVKDRIYVECILHTHTHICVYIYICVCVYIYIYTYERERERIWHPKIEWRPHEQRLCAVLCCISGTLKNDWYIIRYLICICWKSQLGYQLTSQIRALFQGINWNWGRKLSNYRCYVLRLCTRSPDL